MAESHHTSTHDVSTSVRIELLLRKCCRFRDRDLSVVESSYTNYHAMASKRRIHDNLQLCSFCHDNLPNPGQVHRASSGSAGKPHHLQPEDICDSRSLKDKPGR